MRKADIFYAKILLFGEYSVIFDSMGLTIPYTHFKGELSFIDEDKYTDYDFAINSNELLKEYLPYLKDLDESGALKCNINLKNLEADINKGMYFESTIPLGFGLGSSGALVASIYDRYVSEKIKNDWKINKANIIKLKDVFSQMESYFHGKSSGLDPLNSYIKFPLLIKNKEEIELVGLPRNRVDGNGAIFLINSGKPGKTGPLVNSFLKKCENSDFLNLIKTELIPLNNRIINYLINGEINRFFKGLGKLSQFQLNHFEYMIPENLKKQWQEGIATGEYYLKLCGSGGGGFILGFTKNYNHVLNIMKGQNLELITVFRNPKT